VTDVDRVERDLAEACWTIAADWDASLHGKREAPGVGPVKGTREAPMPVPVGTLDDRAECTSRLASWALLVLEERDLQSSLDGFDAIALARFVSTHAQWLASHDAGTEAARELTDSARKITRLARPERRDYVVIGDCPRTVASPEGESVQCCGRVTAKMVQTDAPEHPGLTEDDKRDLMRETLGTVVAKCQRCEHQDTVNWWESQIVPDLEAEDLLTAAQLVVFVHQKTRQVITEDAIRQWATRGFIRRHGRDQNRTLYDPNAVLAWVRTRTKERVRTAA